MSGAPIGPIGRKRQINSSPEANELSPSTENSDQVHQVASCSRLNNLDSQCATGGKVVVFTAKNSNGDEEEAPKHPLCKIAKKMPRSNVIVIKQAKIQAHVSSDDDIQEVLHTVVTVVACHCTKFADEKVQSDSEQDCINTRTKRSLVNQHDVSPGAAAADSSPPKNHSCTATFGSASFKSYIAQAVKCFTFEIYCPHLLSAKSRMASSTIGTDRIIISALLAIQEMLIMNTCNHFPSSPPAKVHDFVHTIIQASTKHLSSVSSTFTVDKFALALQCYTSKRADFRVSLMRADARLNGILSDGSKCSQVENITNRATFNYSRANHPLANTMLSQMPSPTCITFPMKLDPDQEQT